MKREISMEISTGGHQAVLTGVASAIQERGLPLESLTWSEVLGTSEARLWMVVDVEEDAFDGLVNALCGISGVDLITSLGPGQTLIKRLRGPKQVGAAC